jgi:hypothetical protein
MTFSNPSLPSNRDAASTMRAADSESRSGDRSVLTVSNFVLVLLVGFLLFDLLAFRQSDSLLWDPDSYWHIATGQKIWETGSLPHFDEFSHTFQGHPWTVENWLADLMLFGAFHLGGWRGVILLTTFAAVFSYAVLYLVLSRQFRLTVAVGVVAAAFAFSTGHFSARPQIFVDGLMILWTAGLVNAVENRAAPSWLLLPIATLWANLHPSVTFGLALAGALAGEAFLLSPPGQRLLTARKWALFLGLACAAACITPYGYAPILNAFQVFSGNEALPYIQEWRPLTIQVLSINELILLALLFLAMNRGVKIPAFRLLMVLGVFYLMMSHLRFESLFAFITPILLAPTLARQFSFLRLSTQLEQDPQFFTAMERIAQWGLYPVCAAITLAVIADAGLGGTVAPRAEITPAGAVDYIYRERLTGKIYNPYNFGGYLIFRNIKTFIDGRSEQLFLDGFTDRLFDIINKHPRKFVPFLATYDIKLALVAPDSIESQELDASEAWEKVYSDKVAELFRKRGS